MNKESLADGAEVSLRTALLFVPIVLTQRFLGVWLPKPFAVSMSMDFWLMAIYWLPTRTNLSLRRWLIVVAASTMLGFILATFQPDMF